MSADDVHGWHFPRLGGRVATIVHLLVSAIAGTAFAFAPVEANALGFTVAVLVFSPGQFRLTTSLAGRRRHLVLFLARSLAGLLLSGTITGG